MAETSPPCLLATFLLLVGLSLHGVVIASEPQTASLACGKVADICFLIESSINIRYNGGSDDHWSDMMEFVNRVMDGFDTSRDGTRVGLVTFSTYATPRIPLSFHDPYYRKSAISNVPYENGFSNTSAGILTMSNQCFQSRDDRANFPNIGIIVTNGDSTIDKAKTIPAAVKARNSGIHLITLGISRGSNTQETSGMSSVPQTENTNWFWVNSYESLMDKVSSVVVSACAAAMSVPKKVTTPRPRSQTQTPMPTPRPWRTSTPRPVRQGQSRTPVPTPAPAAPWRTPTPHTQTETPRPWTPAPWTQTPHPGSGTQTPRPWRPLTPVPTPRAATLIPGRGPWAWTSGQTPVTEKPPTPVKDGPNHIGPLPRPANQTQRDDKGKWHLIAMVGLGVAAAALLGVVILLVVVCHLRSKLANIAGQIRPGPPVIHNAYAAYDKPTA